MVEQGPYAVNVTTPSDRGPLNGSGATEDAKLSAHFSHTAKTHRTVSYRSRVAISGRLENSSGRPISGALLRVLTRDRRQGARFVERYTTTRLRRQLPREGARGGVAPDPDRVALPHQGPWLPGERDLTLPSRASSSLDGATALGRRSAHGCA